MYRNILLLSALAAWPTFADDFDHAPINYSSSRPENVISRLQERIDTGKVQLSFTDDHAICPQC